MISKDVLNQYTNIRKEISEVQQRIVETEMQIERLEKGGTVLDRVKGGEGGIQPFKIEGFPQRDYTRKKILLNNRKNQLSCLELDLLETANDVEQFISELNDSHIRRIVSLRFIEGLSWSDVADAMGGGNTEDSVRKTFTRFMAK